MSETVLKVGDKMWFAIEFMRQVVADADAVNDRTTLGEVVNIVEETDGTKMLYIERVGGIPFP